MHLSHIYRPVRFFLITFLGTWTLWFIAAYYSYQKGMGWLQLLFMMSGLFMPFIAALIMIYGSKDKELIKDFWDRLSFYRVKFSYLIVVLLLMPSVLFLATGFSLLFGQSIDQFTLSSEYEVMKGWSIFSLLTPLFLAPTLEELGWRGYGMDSLKASFTLFVASLVFALLWALWHVPLFFIKGFYQHELWNASSVYVINFFVSLLPAVILMNWMYYKNCRSITAVIMFHSIINLSSVLFKTTQFTKCIITVLLLIVSAVVIMKNKQLFFSDNASNDMQIYNN